MKTKVIRRRPPKGSSRDTGVIRYPTTEEPIVLSKPLLDLILKQERPAELIALYIFYYYTAKWQRTYRLKATTSYVSKGLGWGLEKVRRTKKQLIQMGLIEDVVSRDLANKITGHYIQIRFTPMNDPTLRVFHRVENPEGNTSIYNNKNISLASFENDAKGERSLIVEKNKPYLPIARRLSTIIQTTKRIKHTPRQVQNWANEIRKLVERQGVEVSRVELALNWYATHVGDPYVPIIESGKSLRNKFIRLEAAMERDRQTTMPIKDSHPHLTKIITRVFPEVNNTKDLPKIHAAIRDLREWRDSCVKKWKKKGKRYAHYYSNIPSTASLLVGYVEWLDKQSWIDDVHPTMFRLDSRPMRKYLKRVQEQKCFDFETGEIL